MGLFCINLLYVHLISFRHTKGVYFVEARHSICVYFQMQCQNNTLMLVYMHANIFTQELHNNAHMDEENVTFPLFHTVCPSNWLTGCDDHVRDDGPGKRGTAQSW